VIGCDISVNSKEVAVLSAQGSISVLDLEASSFNVLMRSHQEDIVDIAFNKMVGKLVTIGKDCCIKVWNAKAGLSMDVEDEFVI
jgi:WD40 repeat protein